jgi:histone acetyltransferase HTATIP
VGPRSVCTLLFLCLFSDDRPDATFANIFTTALSDLGRQAYIHYWSATLARTILTCPSKRTLTVLDLREKTYIVPEDIIATLQAMDVLEHKKKGGAEAVINKAKVRSWADSHRINLQSLPVDPEAFVLRESSRSASEE